MLAKLRCRIYIRSSL